MFTPAEVPQSLDQQFEKTKGQLFFQKGAGFYGSLLCKLHFCWTHEIPTAAISADTLYWNPDFFQKMNKDGRVTVLAHEIEHNARMHGARINGRCPDIWNIAGDHVINLNLKNHGYSFENLHEIGISPVMDDKYHGMSTEEIYDDLISPGGGGMTPFSDQGVPGLGQDVIKISEKDLPKVINNVVTAATTARMSGQAGDIPGEITTIIDQFLNPKLPWETLLFNFFNEMVSQEYSYARPNRRYDDPLLPGPTGRNGLEHLIYFLDISGSISDDEIVRFNSEVKFIQEELQPERLTLVTFDTSIHDIVEFERDDEFEKLEITGRGGTSLYEVYKYIQKEAPTAAVIFTDLYVNIPDTNPGIPLLWVCTGHKSAQVPYGTLIHMEDH